VGNACHIEPRLKPEESTDSPLELKQDTPLFQEIVTRLASEAAKLNRETSDPTAGSKASTERAV
jgi:hypothetical protein